MKKLFGLISIIAFALMLSCKEADVSIFDKTPDQRVAEAVTSLKNDLTAPSFGWKLKYKPTPDAGSFYVLLNFKDDNQLIIQSDLGVRDGKFFQDTLTYRIDSSLGLQLVFETYSMFSYLFEQGAATFEAEYEFIYINKTPDGALVFKSKSDQTTANTTLVFEEASSNDTSLLGQDISTNLNLMNKDLNINASSLKMTYQNKDLILYVSLDDITRTIEIPTASKKTNTTTTASISFSSGYYLKGDSIVFETPLIGTYLGISLNLKSIKLNSLASAQINECSSPIATHNYTGVTSSNDPVILETSLLNASGRNFTTKSTFYVSELQYIFHNGVNVTDQLKADLAGVLAMELYYNYDVGSSNIYSIGFLLQNADGSVSFALRDFTPTLNNNNLIFNLKSKINIYGNANPDANINNINSYVDGLAEGGHTFVFRLNDNFYEFYNPCSGWDVIFQAY
jgi:hypothetical protein